MNATLDPAHGTVHIHSVAPLRDVDPTAIPALLDSLRAWAARCDAALSDLDARVKTIRAAADARAQAQAEWDVRVKKLVEDEAKSSQAQGGGAGAAERGQGLFGGGHGHGFGGGSGAHVLPARGPGGSKTGQGRGMRSYMKRGSGHMDGGADEVDDEAMDVDEEDEVADKKRTSRRKLLG